MLSLIKDRFGISLPLPGLTVQALSVTSKPRLLFCKSSGCHGFLVLCNDRSKNVAAIVTADSTKFISLCATDSYFNGTLFIGEVHKDNNFYVAQCLVFKSLTGERYSGPFLSEWFNEPMSKSDAINKIKSTKNAIIPLIGQPSMLKLTMSSEIIRESMFCLFNDTLYIWEQNQQYTIVLNCEFSYSTKDGNPTASFMLRDKIKFMNGTIFYYGYPLNIVHLNTEFTKTLLRTKTRNATISFKIAYDKKHNALKLEALSETTSSPTTLSEINKMVEMMIDVIPYETLQELV